MLHESAHDAKWRWLRSTLERLASMPQLSDDDFGYVVFEDLVPDAWSCLHESSLEPLVSAGSITRSIKAELLEIRATFFELVDAAQAAGAPSITDIRRDARWLDIARWSERILSECIDLGTG